MKAKPMFTSPLLRRLITRARDLPAGKSGTAADRHAIRSSCGGFSKVLPFRRLLDNTAGVAAVEFAILSPALLAMLLGMFSFGVAMRDYMILTNAATQVALTVALSRGTTLPYGTKIQPAITAATSTLTTPAAAAATITIDSVACNSDASCTTNLVAGRSALVTATYPCTLSVMGINYKPGCTLTASTAQMIQ